MCLLQGLASFEGQVVIGLIFAVDFADVVFGLERSLPGSILFCCLPVGMVFVEQVGSEGLVVVLQIVESLFLF